MEPGADAETAATGRIGLREHLGTVDHQPAGGEVRPVEQLHQPRVFDMRIVDQQERGIDHLGDIVAGDVGRHPDRDPARAIGEQIGEQAWKDFRLLLLAIVGGDEIDRALVEAFHQPHRGTGHPRFGVAIGGGVIAVDIAEIALPLDQRVAQREILRETDHGIVNAGIAVRMILADDVADHAGALLEGVGGVELQLAHRPQQPAVDRLQPVAQIRQRTRGDGRQRIDQIALGQRGIEGRIDNRVDRIGNGGVCLGHLYS